MLLKLIQKSLGRKRTAAKLHELALVHNERGELDRAEQLFREVAMLNPGEVSAWTNLAATILKQHKYAAAIPVLQEIIELQPELAEAHHDLGTCQHRLRNNAEAIKRYRKAIALKPTLAVAHASMANAYLDSCDWDGIDRWTGEFLEYRKAHPVQEWAQRVEPYAALTLLPAEICREVAAWWSAQIERSIDRNLFPADAAPPARNQHRIRVGYVSADFYATAMAHLTFSLYETHRRDEFEVYAYSLGPDDGSHYRRQIERTCDHFIDVRQETPERIARRIRADEIDVLIDMKGYTANSRPQIFAYRPAPIQVGYIGFPATTGARYIDYFVSDRVATPPGCETDFTEKIAFLPDCYMVTDHRQPISPQALTRVDYGLPEHAFVYCGFNQLRKVDRKIFSVWMRILRKVPGSVLWLLKDDSLAVSNLRKAAQTHNVDGERLIFAERQEKSVHLARHRLADLFLDTHICNAHTGASDALWAGLPLLTCPGTTFVSRVAASVLSAAGLPELITRDLAEYEEMAVRLAQDRALLAGLRTKLDQNRATCALFDTPAYVRNLEAAYRRMLDIHRGGGIPEAFSVA